MWLLIAGSRFQRIMGVVCRYFILICTEKSVSIYVYIYIYMFVCVCVFVCVSLYICKHTPTLKELLYSTVLHFTDSNSSWGIYIYIYIHSYSKLIHDTVLSNLESLILKQIIGSFSVRWNSYMMGITWYVCAHVHLCVCVCVRVCACVCECVFIYLYACIHSCIHSWECLRGVMVKAMDCGIVISEFELQSRVHFPTNTLGKGMNPLILLTMG